MMYNTSSMVKLKDVAREANVSEATASLVLNHRPGVNKFTRERVFQAAKDLGYTPNSIARNLATRRSRTIGLVVTDINNPFFSELTKRVDGFVQERGYELILSLSDDKPDKEDSVIDSFVGKMVEGIIVVPTLNQSRRDLSVFKRLNLLSIPYLMLSSYYPGHECECVMADLAHGSYELTRYLINQGKRDLRFLTVSDVNVVPAAERIRGVRAALNEAEIAFTESMVIRSTQASYHSGYEAVKKLLTREVPDAIMSMNDIMALGATRAVLEAGYAVPEDVAIAGYDDLLYAQLSAVPLTTVRQDIESMARTAVERLFSRIEDSEAEHDPQQISIPTELVVRNSTA